MFITLSLLIGVVTLIYVYLTWNFNYWKIRNVPGPKPTILLGNLPNVILQKKSMVHDIRSLYKKYRSEKFIGIFMIRTPNILVIDPEMIKDILVGHFKNFNSNGFEKFIGKGTLFSNNPFFLSGDKWKVKRGEIAPAFTTARIKPIFPLIENVSQNMVTYIDNESPKKTEGFNGKDLCSRFTADVVSSTIFAVEGKSFLEEKPLIKIMGEELMTHSFKAIMLMTILSIIPYFQNIFKISLVTEKTQNFFTKLMNDAFKYRKDNNIEREDYMNYLIKLKKKSGLNEIELAAHGISFFVDGFETSSMAMSYVLYELGKNCEVQEKLRNDIKNNDITYDFLSGYSYLDQVIHESLRLHPVGSPLIKVCSEAFEVSTTDGEKVVIEKGTSIQIPVYSIQRDSEYYTDPDKFNPERFNPEHGGVKHFRDRGLYLSFGDGPRLCLGMKFALLQIQVGILKIVKHFEISVNSKTIEPIELDPKQLLLNPTGGIWLNLKAL